MTKILKRILCGLFVLISLFYVFVVVSTHYFRNFYPFGIRVAVILSGSMEPELKINDFVIVRKAKNVKVGDIVTYRKNNKTDETIHRIVEIDGDTVITKGDANNSVDPVVRKNEITGIYIGKIKYLGNLLAFFRSPFGFSISITILVLILLLPSDILTKNKK